ncbi:GNAT family N-acetyltransferase [Campylobacter fetus]|uniref:Acetyltransferase, gnat family n=2 Tax=Campylobacter fetus TaxID=196 RepID=A0RN40_CAMFF|nr:MULTISPECIES: GNAT family N-acetyltransferase [Campylobacter]HDX6329952.1 GNAT family N-acetyltransferase [Campylobacter fetus subsp. venerealis]ABK82636.1 acetyltransferase, gnat family [Campylobacter fetus subsp. fetus 82-40]EAI3886471.1 GNAT family N-acetyltransferase [Campylobacter fetus]EAI3915551.1 GNAT family N-acetyltransferase [Campylobacter fetus]EAI3919186.1 GNAT family N-acetyltransferase [Campylobacter fetus]
MIRNATKNDAKRVIELLNLAMDNIAFTLSGATDIKISNTILEEFFRSTNNRLSYENILVFEFKNEVIGAICIYESKMAKELDIAFINRLKSLGIEPNIKVECDTQNNELYIDSIAVDENHRGKGVAKQLIEASFLRAKELGINLSLLVDEAKSDVKSYYKRVGFKPCGNKEILNHKYIYMIKEIK